MESTNKILKGLYYDTKSPAGFSTARKLWVAARKKKPGITLKQVQQWLKAQDIYSKFARPRRKFSRATFVSNHPNQIWVADLADLSPLKRYNNGYKYLLICQDLFTRKLKALVAQKNKTAKLTSESFDKIFTKEHPAKLGTDRGTEFLGRPSKEIYKKYGVEHYTSYDVGAKMATVERAILEVKKRMYKIMAHQNSWKWVGLLPDIMKVYNDTYNRTLRMTPNEAGLEQNEADVFYNSVTRAEDRKLEKKLKFHFEIGQPVRVQKDQVFGKSFVGAFSDIIYVVYARDKKTGIPMYYLKELLTGEEIEGGFYGPELQPVEIDQNKVAKIDKIYGIRLNPENQQEIKAKFNGEKQAKWILYKDLLHQ